MVGSHRDPARRLSRSPGNSACLLQAGGGGVASHRASGRDTAAGHRPQRSSCPEPTMNSMRAAVLWVYLLRGAALHDSPVDTLVAASRGTARVAEKVCFTSGEAALCLPLLPAGNSNLCGGRTCYVMDRAVLSGAQLCSEGA